ncbi:MAG: hypothetical protein JO110_19915 [Acetobacteraceae bacterium]|nr:hypothetical protein [Acetobacteraceae bacterium]
MAMPGLTAEASLSRTTTLWNTEGAAPAAAREERVVPQQFCICPEGGAYCTCCYCYGGYCTCTHLQVRYK